jgi:hypothetical protein
MHQTDLRIDQNMVSLLHGDECVECMHLLLRYCDLFVLGIQNVETLCEVFKPTSHCDLTYEVCEVTYFKYT